MYVLSSVHIWEEIRNCRRGIFYSANKELKEPRVFPRDERKVYKDSRMKLEQNPFSCRISHSHLSHPATRVISVVAKAIRVVMNVPLDDNFPEKFQKFIR